MNSSLEEWVGILSYEFPYLANHTHHVKNLRPLARILANPDDVAVARERIAHNGCRIAMWDTWAEDLHLIRYNEDGTKSSGSPLGCASVESLGFRRWDVDLSVGQLAAVVWFRDYSEHQCAECSKWIENGRGTTHCFMCGFWLPRLKELSPNQRQGFVSVNYKGVLEWHACSSSGGPKEHKGYGGARWRLTFPNGAQIFHDNVWCGGNVPARFVDRFLKAAGGVTEMISEYDLRKSGAA